MALSNWDTLTIDENGNATNGSFLSPLGVKVSFYKNNIHIEDPVAWQEGGSFVKDIVMEVQEGEFRYKDVNINTVRGPQSGIYAVAYTNSYEEKFRCMVGCAVYGYADDGEKDEDGLPPFVGVKPSSRDFLQSWILRSDWSSREECEAYVREVNGGVGFSEDSIQRQIEDRMKYTFFPKEIASLNISKAKRFNQGDDYFVGHDQSMTEVGQASPTIMSKIVKEIL